MWQIIGIMFYFYQSSTTIYGAKMKIDNDKISVGGIPVAELAQRFGTPLYVYDEAKIRDNYRRVYQTFTKYYPDFEMFYAVKCCNNPAIVNIMRQEGAGADCASVNEILLAKSVGLTGEKVMFSGNFLSDDDIRQGLESGVIFNLDDISILPRLLKFGTPEMISFRVNPGYGKSNVVGCIRLAVEIEQARVAGMLIGKLESAEVEGGVGAAVKRGVAVITRRRVYKVAAHKNDRSLACVSELMEGKVCVCGKTES